MWTRLRTLYVSSPQYAAVSTSFLYLIPPTYYWLLAGVQTPILLFGRGSQVLFNYRQGHTGVLSWIPLFMSAGGSCARVATVLVQIGLDVPLIAAYAISASVNLVLLAQVVVYRKRTAEVMGKKEK